MSQTLQGKVSLFAAMEAQKSRELGKDLLIRIPSTHITDMFIEHSQISLFMQYLFQFCLCRDKLATYMT